MHYADKIRFRPLAAKTKSIFIWILEFYVRTQYAEKNFNTSTWNFKIQIFQQDSLQSSSKKKGWSLKYEFLNLEFWRAGYWYCTKMLEGFFLL